MRIETHNPLHVKEPRTNYACWNKRGWGEENHTHIMQLENWWKVSAGDMTRKLDSMVFNWCPKPGLYWIPSPTHLIYYVWKHKEFIQFSIPAILQFQPCLHQSRKQILQQQAAGSIIWRCEKLLRKMHIQNNLIRISAKWIKADNFARFGPLFPSTVCMCIQMTSIQFWILKYAVNLTEGNDPRRSCIHATAFNAFLH